MEPPSLSKTRHILTVSVEDYFHAGVFDKSFEERHWSRFQPRLERNIRSTLELLSDHGAKATFFVLGCIADEQPQLIRWIVEEGHEVASSGYLPSRLDSLSPKSFEEQLERAKVALESAGANRIVGFRAPRNWIKPKNFWALEVLAANGYAYDSSVNPAVSTFRKSPQEPYTHQVLDDGGKPLIWEVPISTVGIGNLRIAISGGNYIRQLPHGMLRMATGWWRKHRQDPLVFYFMPWELDTRQPRFTSVSRLSYLRHYRNLGKTRWVLEHYLDNLKFYGVADHLGIDHGVAEEVIQSPETAAARVPAIRSESPDRIGVSIVIPLYNEEANLQYLRRTLEQLREFLADTYDLEILLVDDGSRDRTWSESKRLFGQSDCFRLIRHESNRGVAAAIQTGIRSAKNTIVCSMDCDCSYDPFELKKMIPMVDEADIVTASPYHPGGGTMHVPAWRLGLSKTLSRLYSLVIGSRLHTFTSCFRVYQKASIADLEIKNPGFLGVAELLILAQFSGARILEYPTTLESRLLGFSKMKTFRTIRGHLRLLAHLTFQRLFGSSRRLAPKDQLL